MDQLEIRVLGGCEFRLGGQPVAGFVSRKAQALACYVALSERPVPRGVLMELFWGDGTDQAGQTSLRKALSNLGQVLGEHILITRNDVALSLGHATVDALRFQQLCAAGDRDALQAAVGCYGGDFLENWGLRDAPQFDEWAAAQRERLREQLEAALFALGERLAADEESWPDSIGLMSRLLQLNPYREDACRHAMGLLARSGQRGAALELYEHCRQRLSDELGLEPLPETAALSERIQTAAPRAPQLPAERTPFVGRPAELAALVGALSDPACRLLTITGAGGMGKTRLALRGAHAIAHHFWDGVWFVNLTAAPPLDDGASLDPCALALADALGLVIQGARPPIRQLQAFLQDKQLLLVLDNFEHLLAASDLLLDLLHQAPQLKLLVTSRERLNLYEEQVLELGGLGVPPEDGAPDQPLDSFSAVQLFCQQAQRVSLGWEPQAGDEAHLARICRLLDGMPLGIELAASWVRVMTCQAIAEQVALGLDFLTSTFRNLPERHRSLRGVFEHSWRLLAPHERRALANIAIFRGGFSRAAAQQVADASLADLAALSDKSLIRRADERFEAHELLRQYAHEHLASTRTAAALQERHALHYLALLARQAGPLRGGDQLGALLEIGQELENIRAAWGWAVAGRHLKPLAAALDGLFHFCDTRSRYREGEALLQAALDAAPPGGDNSGELFRARLMARQGWLIFHLGQPARSRELLLASLERLEALGAPAETVFNLAYLGAVSRHEGDYAQAERFLGLALERAAAAGDRWGQSVALNILGQVASLQGDFGRARERCEQSLQLKRAIDDRWGMTFSLIYLGRIEQALGNPAATEALFRESLALSRDFGDRRGAAFALQNLGDALRLAGDSGQASLLYQQSLELYQAIGARREASLTWSRLGLAASAAGEWPAADHAFSQALQLALASESPTALRLAIESLAPADAQAAGAPAPDARPALADDLMALLGSARAALAQAGAAQGAGA